jgi:hypothetical protein
MDKKIRHQLKYLFSDRYNRYRDSTLKSLGPEGVLTYFKLNDVKPNILFLFWFERKFNQEVFINEKFLVRNIHPVNRSKSLGEPILACFESKVASLGNEFSIIHSDLNRRFQSINQFEFNDLFDWDFLDYLLKLDDYDYVQHFVRTIELKELPATKDHESWKGLRHIEYRKGLPETGLSLHQILGSYVNLNMHGIWKECENEVRTSQGLPSIGEGWVSETLLLKRLQDIFPELEIFPQGSPKFLKGQRYDIWIPSIKVAVEYHGEQHRKPIELFGGAEGFAETKRRDDLKILRSEENEVDLFVVWFDDEIDVFLQKITQFVKAKKGNEN